MVLGLCVIICVSRSLKHVFLNVSTPQFAYSKKPLEEVAGIFMNCFTTLVIVLHDLWILSGTIVMGTGYV